MPAASQVAVVQKPWGETRHITQRNGCGLHHASIERGGYSTQHAHHLQHNDFYVVQGELLIYCYASKDAVEPFDTVRLSRGDFVTLPANDWHRFHALTDVELIEFYWSSVDPSDIERLESVGGIHVTDPWSHPGPS